MSKKGRVLVLLFFPWVLLFPAFSSDRLLRSYKFPELIFFPPMPVSEINPVTVEGAELGRYLFYDSILSLNYDMSCGSCHKQERAFSDAPNKFSRGNHGIAGQRNTMPLFNLAWYSAFFWDGRAEDLETQVLHPIQDTSEMNLSLVQAVRRLEQHPFYRKQFHLVFGKRKIDKQMIAFAIAQFLRTLISYQSRYDRVLSGTEFLNPEEYKGFILMNDMTKGDCLHCHSTDIDALGTTGLFSNNGLDEAGNVFEYKDGGLGGFTGVLKDYGRFKIPSLRNIALTPPYMHDGRFNTLEEVLDFYSEGVQGSINIDPKMGFSHQGGAKLSEVEKRQIIAFLHTLTDSVFIRKPEYSNPFGKNDIIQFMKCD